MRFIALFLTVILFLSCEGGLAPPPVEPGFGGTISFVAGTWPSPDSLVNLWVVASQDYPLDSVTVFAGIFANPPRIYVYPSLTANLPFDVDSAPYTFLLPPGEYKYIAVIQRFKDEINAGALRVVGVYSMASNPSLPRSIIIHDFEFIEQVNISVNFHQLPPQPF